MTDAQHFTMLRPTRMRAAHACAAGDAGESRVERAGELLSAVDAVYCAAETDGHWPAAMAEIARALSGCAAGFLASSGDGRCSATLWHAASDRGVALPGADGAVAPALLALLDRLRGVSPGRVAIRDERGDGAARALAIRTASDAGGVAALVVLRGEGRRPFASGERVAAGILAPHLCRALSMAARARLDDAREHVCRGLLGALIVDASGRVLDALGAAARLCEARAGVALEDGRVAASTAAFTPSLRQAIREVARGDGASPARATALRLPRGDAAEALEVRVVALPPNDGSASPPVGGPQAVAAVLIADVAHRPPADRAVLARLYGFTPAEASLAETLAAGCTLEQAAVDTGLTHETMRSRLKGLFRKTRTHRQADLVARLTAGVAVYACARD